jgi:ABC-type phosphate transport system permease subunit
MKNDIFPFVLGASFGAVLMFLLMVKISDKILQEVKWKVQTEAVQLGHGKWEVTTNRVGWGAATKFEWITNRIEK